MDLGKQNCSLVEDWPQQFISAVALFDVCAHTSVPVSFPIEMQHSEIRNVDDSIGHGLL